MALGISAAAGSFGQFLMLPVTQWLLSNFGWSGALLVLACVALLIAPLAAGARRAPRRARRTRSSNRRGRHVAKRSATAATCC